MDVSLLILISGGILVALGAFAFPFLYSQYEREKFYEAVRVFENLGSIVEATSKVLSRLGETGEEFSARMNILSKLIREGLDDGTRQFSKTVQEGVGDKRYSRRILPEEHGK